MDLNIAFWNTNKKSLDEEISLICKENDIHVFGVAEYTGDIKALLVRLENVTGTQYFHHDQLICERIEIFSVIPFDKNKIGRSTKFYTIRNFETPGFLPLIVAFAHFPSKMYKEEDSLDLVRISQKLKADLVDYENQIGTLDCLILGDLNMNPFESGVISAMGLSAVPCMVAARAETRIVDTEEYRVLYNPMWSKFGYSNGSPGSFYYNKGSQENYYWNIYDQVIYSGTLLGNINQNEITFIRSIFGTKIVDENERPSVSDHLPVKLSVELKEKS